MKCTPNVKYFWGTYQENFPKIFKQYKFYAPSEYRKTYTNFQNKSEEIRNRGITFSNRILSSGFFPFPAHGEPGQGSADRQSSVLAGKLFFATAHFLLMSSPFSMLQQIQIAAPCPVSSETGFFLQRYTSVSSIFFKIPLSSFYFEKQKRRMRVFHPPRRLDAKKFLIRLFVIQFFFACRVKNPMT